MEDPNHHNHNANDIMLWQTDFALRAFRQMQHAKFA